MTLAQNFHARHNIWLTCSCLGALLLACPRDQPSPDRVLRCDEARTCQECMGARGLAGEGCAFCPSAGRCTSERVQDACASIPVVAAPARCPPLAPDAGDVAPGTEARP